MINANELRIGNYIYYKDDKYFYDVRALCRDRVHPINIVEHDGNIRYAVDCTLSDLEPIPLTDEILVRFGFELFPWGWVKKSQNDFGVRINIKSYNYEVSGNSSVKIEFLHQLQNLFFFLTNEELEAVSNGS